MNLESIGFVMPHWLYWGWLAFIPLVIMAIGHKKGVLPPVPYDDKSGGVERAFDWISDRSGLFVALWSMSAVCAYTYEVVARYLARAAQPQPSLLYGTPGDALSAGEADHWVHHAQSVIATAKGPAVTAALQRVDRHLRMRTVMAGHAVGLADAAVWLALRAHDKELKAQAKALPHLTRWWRMVEAMEAMQKVSQEFFGAHKDAGNMEIPLPGAEMGKVVTRFPPEPSGHLHIGHVKAAMLNAHFATQYEGRLLLRFDDTNPSKEKGEYEEAIIEDLKRLNITPSSVSHTSDHFAAILRLQTRMLEEDLAYVDPSPQEEQKKERMAKQENKYRSQPVAENLRLWGEMQKASEEGLKCCVRQRGHTALARS